MIMKTVSAKPVKYKQHFCTLQAKNMGEGCNIEMFFSLNTENKIRIQTFSLLICTFYHLFSLWNLSDFSHWPQHFDFYCRKRHNLPLKCITILRSTIL